MWCGLHHTANEAELFSPHWVWERPGVKRFFTSGEHKQIKAALHCQSDGEEVGVTDLDGKPMLKKIGILLDHFRKRCTQMYHPGADLAYDEISILMTGRSSLKKQLRFKPSCLSCQSDSDPCCLSCQSDSDP
jgi:hypothetical protein